MKIITTKHSVLLKEEKCEGCTNCVKNCPTRAIRVHRGKATIKENFCIDCSECIRTCEYHAKYTETNSLKDITEFSYSAALIPPSFYGQFEPGIKPVEVVSGLYKLGFKEARDVALAAEALSKKTAQFLVEREGFFISSSCPVVVRLIKLLYPELLDFLIPFKSPVELTAQVLKKELLRKGISTGDMGIFFITPCPAKLTTINNSPGQKESYLDGAIAADRIYPELFKKIKDLERSDHIYYDSPWTGLGWGQSGGEESILREIDQQEVLSVSGIHNVKRLLEELSRNNIKGIKYFELTACPQGCVGGVLNVKNSFQAKHNLKSLSGSKNSFREQDLSIYEYHISGGFCRDDVGKLDSDMNRAMEKLALLEEEIELLPGLDCAACGAPDCKTLAEDIVNGLAKRTDCIFMLRKSVSDLADRISDLAHVLPPVMAEKERGDRDEPKKDN